MEDDLDSIAGRRRQRGRLADPVLLRRAGRHEGKEGGLAQQGGLKKLVGDNLGDIDARDVNSIVIGRDDAGREVVVRVGRYGPYVQIGEDGDSQLRASLPDDLAPDELTVERAVELANAPSGDRVLGADPATGFDVVAKSGPLRPLRHAGAAGGLQGQAADGARCSRRWTSRRSRSTTR